MLERKKESGLTEEVVLQVIAEKDPELSGHLKRVGDLCIKIGNWFGLDSKDKDLLGRAGRLHDCGKIGITPEILAKQGALNEDEWKIIGTHPRFSFLLARQNDEDLARIIVAHHEQGNRSRYPRRGQRRSQITAFPDFIPDQRTGRKRRGSNQRINNLAELLSIADIFDALSHTRAYKTAWSKEEVRRELLKTFPHRTELIDFLLGNC